MKPDHDAIYVLDMKQTRNTNFDFSQTFERLRRLLQDDFGGVSVEDHSWERQSGDVQQKQDQPSCCCLEEDIISPSKKTQNSHLTHPCSATAPCWRNLHADASSRNPVETDTKRRSCGSQMERKRRGRRAVRIHCRSKVRRVRDRTYKVQISASVVQCRIIYDLKTCPNRCMEANQSSSLVEKQQHIITDH